MLAGMEETAVELEMKMRFLDAIRDMKQELAEPLLAEELRKKSLEIDELVRELKKQVTLESREIALNEVTSVTEREVEERVRGFLEECREANQEILLNDRKGYATYVQEAERDMRDLANVSANYETVTDATRFCDSFYKIGSKLDEQIGELAKPCAENLMDNYDRAIKRIGNMLSDTGYRPGIQRELYTKWSTVFESMKEQLREKAGQMDYGGRAIKGFADEHTGPVQKIIEKVNRKYKRIKKIPLYVMLSVLAILIVFIIVLFVMAGRLAGTVGEVVANEIETNGLSDTVDSISEFGSGIAALLKMFGTGSVDSAAAVGGGWIAIIILALMGLLWVFLCRLLNKRCKKQICSEVGAYLSERLDVFWQTEPISEQIKMSFEQMNAHAEFLSGKKLNEIFGGMVYDTTQNEASGIGRMLRLCREWEQIKRSAT